MRVEIEGQEVYPSEGIALYTPFHLSERSLVAEPLEHLDREACQKGNGCDSEYA
jgi:hypothetical protein